jgi:hypothetical protein
VIIFKVVLGRGSNHFSKLLALTLLLKLVEDKAMGTMSFGDSLVVVN